jgi:uncharacterized protein (TIRG00374 family)
VSRTLIWNLCKYVLAFGLLGLVVYWNWEPDSNRGLKHVWNRHVIEGESIAVGYLGLAFLLLTFSFFVTFVRWYFLVRAQGLAFHIKDALRLGLYGMFASTFLPGSVGGDAVKAVGLARGQKRRTAAVATVLMDRAIAVWAMLMMVAMVGGILWTAGLLDNATSATLRIVRISGIFIAVSIVVWLALGFLPQRRADKFAWRLSRIPKIGHSVAEFSRAVWIYRCRQKSVFLALALTWLGQLGFVFGFYFSVLTLYDPAAGSIPSAAEHFLLVPIGLIIQAAPLFPGGAGIGEAGFGGLYAWFGCAAAVAVMGSLVMRVLTWIFALAGFVVAQRLHPRAAPEEEPEAVPGPLMRSACDHSPAA